ncbi:unnamed protein product [Absidia cylindrospora]
MVLVTGPHTTKNEPIIEDKRLDRARPVMHLDRRTHRGDPPAWLPAFWSKPGIYPLSLEFVSIIKMVSSLPFDRHTTTTNTPPSTAISGILGTGQSMALSPMVTMMPHILQQQQYQRMLQFQFQQQQQQQQQFQPICVSPVTSTASSSYTQRKPITPHVSIGNTIPHFPSASCFPSPSPVQADMQKKKTKKQQASPPTPLSLASTPSIQRKEVKTMTGKRRVRFTEDQPQITIFEPETHSVDEMGDMEFIDDNSIYSTGYTGSDDEYYDGDGAMMEHGASHYYDENEYHQHEDRYGYADDLVDYDIDYRDDDINQYYNMYSNDGLDDGQNFYYWNEANDEEEYRRPCSSMDYGKTQNPVHYLASSRRHRNKRHYSASSSSAQGPEPQQQKHHSLTARRPRTSAANPRMWQPSRVQRHDYSVARSSSTGVTNSQRYRSMNV